MNKILKVLSMLFVIASIVFVAGCANKSTNSQNASATENVVDPVCKMNVSTSVNDTSVYKGQTYYFCSRFCKNEFDKDPEKYLNPQNNTIVTDPVCKMNVSTSVNDTSVYKGKTYYFCSPYCKNEFDKDPEEFLNPQKTTTVTDPVCKMKVKTSVIDTSVYKGQTYYFCSPYCKNEFDKDPVKFLNSQNTTMETPATGNMTGNMTEK